MAPTRRILLLLFLISASLRAGLLAAWARLLALAPGPGPADIAAVLAAVLAAMAAGSVITGRYVDRSGRHPLAVYGLTEIGIGLYAVVSPVLVTLPAEIAGGIHILPAGGAWTLRFLLALAGLGIPAALMGGSLPALARVNTLRAEHAGWTVGSVHAAGLVGSTAGAGLFFFRLLPDLGTRASILLAATGCSAVGLLALEIVRRWWSQGLPVPGPVTAAVDRGGPATGASRAVPALAGGAGLATALYLTAWMRVQGLVLGPSIQAGALFAITSLAALSLGALIGARLGDRLDQAERYGLAAGLMGGAALAGHATLLQAPQLPLTFALAFHGFGLGGPVPPGSPGWFFRYSGIQLMVTAAAILPACIFLGTVFPLLARIHVKGVEGIGARSGSLQAWGLGGLAAGGAVSCLAVLPAAGLRGGILAGLLAALAAAGMTAWVAEGWRPAWRHVATAGALAAAVLVTRAGPAWDPYVMSSGVHAYATDWLPLDLHNRRFASMLRRNQRLLRNEEGRTATVLVSRDAVAGSTWMAVDGVVQRDSRTTRETALLLGHLPLLHLPRSAGEAPSMACLGCGTGMIVTSLLRYRPRRVVVVQPEAAVFRGAAAFEGQGGSPLESPEVRLIAGDARGWLGTATELFDVVILAPGSSWAGPAARLATLEALQSARDRLEPGGVAALWVPVGWMDPAQVRTALRTFTAVFSRVKAYMPVPWRDIILLGSEIPFPVDPGRAAALLEDPSVARDLEGARIRTVEDLLTYHLMNDPEARAFAGEGIINTDDNALLELAVPLTAHGATPEPLRRVLLPHAGDPLEDAEAVREAPSRRAAAYDRLGRAFFRRGMMRRALAAQARAHDLDPAPARTARLEAWSRRVPGEWEP